jgi:DinB superfamily
MEGFMQETPQQYTQRIKAYIEGKDPMRVQQETHKKLQKLIKPLSKKQLSQRPEPGKWSIGEILAHLADAELVGSWRMRSIIGNNGVPVQAFDQDVWATTFVGVEKVTAIRGSRWRKHVRRDCYFACFARFLFSEAG